MKKILDRNFIAISLNGKSYNIYDLPQLISDYGLRYFYQTFGYDYGKITYNPSRPMEWDNGTMQWTKFSARSYDTEYKFIITDGFGRKYSPEHLVEEFFNDYPKKAEKLLDGYRRRHYSRAKSWWKSLKKSQNRKIEAQHEMLIQEGTKGIRKIKDYYSCPYDEYYRDPTRNWKSYRKNQYR